MKQFKISGRILSKHQQRTIAGGNRTTASYQEAHCILPGVSCNDNVQCCSLVCAIDHNDNITGKTCTYP